MFRFDLCDFFDNNEVMAEWESYSRGVGPKCWKYPSDRHHFMHAQPMGLHIVINAKEIIITSPQAVRLSLTRVDIKTHSSPFNECILLGIVNLGPATPSL